MLEGEEGEAEQLVTTQEDDEPLVAWVFKSINDRYVGTLTFFRIFSGSVQADTRYYNSTRRSDERFGPLIIMRGKEQSKRFPYCIPATSASSPSCLTRAPATHLAPRMRICRYIGRICPRHSTWWLSHRAPRRMARAWGTILTKPGRLGPDPALAP